MASHLSLRRYFNLFNRKYFNNEVPHGTSVIWAPLNGNNGEYQAGVIRIDIPLQGTPKMAKIILLHEMIHAHRPRANHGRVFQAEIRRLFEAGAYRRLL
jgi:hypothetical protein